MPSANPTRLGRAIRAVRQYRCLKTKDLAALTGISMSHLSGIETMPKDMPLSKIAVIAEALGIPCWLLIWLADCDSPNANLPVPAKSRDGALCLWYQAVVLSSPPTVDADPALSARKER